MIRAAALAASLTLAACAHPLSAPAATPPTMHELEIILRPTAYCGMEDTLGPCGFMLAKIEVHAIRCVSAAPSYGKPAMACRVSWTTRSASLGVQEHRNECVHVYQMGIYDGVPGWLRTDASEHPQTCETDRRR